MTARKQSTVIPRAPHPDTLRDPQLTILDSSGTCLICYCPRHRCGAIYHIEIAVWSMEQPIGFSEFLRALKARNLIVEDSEDLQRWIDACTASGHAPGSVH